MTRLGQLVCVPIGIMGVGCPNEIFKQTSVLFFHKLKTTTMTANLSETKDDGDMIGNKNESQKQPKMLYSLHYRNRIITLFDNGRASIGGIMFDSEAEAKKQVDFLCNIKVIDTRG